MAAKKEIKPKTITSSRELSQEEKNDTSKEEILKEVQLHIEKGEYEKAISGLNKAIELDPRDASLYYTLGDLYEQLGRDKESVEAFVKALQLDKGQTSKTELTIKEKKRKRTGK